MPERGSGKGRRGEGRRGDFNGAAGLSSMGKLYRKSPVLWNGSLERAGVKGPLSAAQSRPVLRRVLRETGARSAERRSSRVALMHVTRIPPRCRGHALSRTRACVSVPHGETHVAHPRATCSYTSIREY